MEFEEWARRTYQSEERYCRAQEMLLACLEEDKADLRVRLEDDAIHFTFRTVMLMGKRAGKIRNPKRREQP